jgi:SpoIID/LytB domain protein
MPLRHLRLFPSARPGARALLAAGRRGRKADLRAPLLGLVLLLAGGCRASDQPLGQVPPPPPLPALGPQGGEALRHWPVPAAPPLHPVDPVLWVALAAHLGPAGEADQAPPLRLAAATGDLTLVDGSGRRLSRPELVLTWRWEPLAQPLSLRRRVLGPFASYESAEAAARRWQAAGVRPEIARGQDWEVWGPAEAAPPPAQASRLVERRPTRRLGLQLASSEGALALHQPLRIEAPGGLRWKGGVYAGPFRLMGDAYGTWTLVEEVPLERYLEGVVPHEIGAGAPPAALAVQAVLARTWAVRNRLRYQVDGYHLCADTQCQVYQDPRQASAAVRRAIASTRGQVLGAAGQPIHAVYHASNGGVAAGLEEAWDVEAVPYLRAFADGPAPFVARTPLPLAPPVLGTLLQDGSLAYGADHPLFRWQRRLSAARISAALGGRAAAVGEVRGVRVLERGPSGRVLALEIAGANGTTVLRRDAIRRTLRELPSTLFLLSATGSGAWRVDGGGFGHGAGLSQAGAIDLGRQGWGVERILSHYYPGAVMQPLTGLGNAL